MPVGAQLRTTGALGAAWLASVGLACGSFPGESVWPFSRLAACALPWIALAGVPRAGTRAGASPDSGFSAGLLWCAGALGPLLAAARLDQLDGLPLAVLLPVLVLALASTGLLALAAARAQGGRAYSVAWTASVLAPPLLGAVLALFGEPALAARAWPEWSPLGWAWTCAADPLRGSRLFALVVPAAIGVLLCFTARRVRPVSP